ncbi:glycoside hydrolase family 6 protein [Microbacterium sp. NPDC019599]|uniref:glycoside hydrolase family 6 protein n=1 Tax=Microbacterium sp. NPDC019599 TaxID=3154690 RepID=UPI0033FF95DF
MTTSRARRALAAVGAATALAAASFIAITPAHADEPGLAGADLFVNPFSTTLEAAQALGGQARDDAQLLGSIPSAEWFTKGTPEEVEAAARLYVDRATEAGAMPVLVAYNLPFRDCAQYSAGGATSTAEYEAWIDAFAAGIGDRPATVILEPDGLGIIPWYTTFEGTAEWCKPAEADPATAASDRFAQLNHAVDALGSLAATSVYLDGTHSGWLNVGDITDRLLKAGVERADGFYLNASNYNYTPNLTFYGSWISSCIALVTEKGAGPGSCPNQYWNGWAGSNWQGVALSNYGEWTLGNPDPALDATGPTQRFADALGGTDPTTHFVIDTSRNGVGPWDAPDGVYSDPEDWCNPPARGLGARPTTETGVALLDAYLWIKVPGESDGKCYRGTGGPLDPERGIEDPAAGQWFAEQARELIEFAEPGLAALHCHVSWDATGSGKAAAARVRVDGADGPWAVWFWWSADQKATKATHAKVSQTGHIASVAGSGSKPGNAPDTVLSVKGAAEQPWIFWLDGQACTSD